MHRNNDNATVLMPHEVMAAPGSGLIKSGFAQGDDDVLAC
jgi:hypothetical protein